MSFLSQSERTRLLSLLFSLLMNLINSSQTMAPKIERPFQILIQVQARETKIREKERGRLIIDVNSQFIWNIFACSATKTSLGNDLLRITSFLAHSCLMLHSTNTGSNSKCQLLSITVT
jgi:hypothetical protein